MAETIFQDWPPHAGWREHKRRCVLKLRLLTRRDSLIVRWRNEDVRMAFQRLADAEFLAEGGKS